jgi:hypothetical protein
VTLLETVLAALWLHRVPLLILQVVAVTFLWGPVLERGVLAMLLFLLESLPALSQLTF